MALKQHRSVDERFRQQVLNAREYLLPFVEEAVPIREGMTVLEIGAGEGGVLQPFVERGCRCVGVDLSEPRIAVAREQMAEAVAAGSVRFLAIDVYETAFQEEFDGHFDLILLKDTIEHIPDQERFIPYILRFLKPGGHVFFGFPPWRMPYGGHQQTARSRLAYVPYVHLLPRTAYARLLRTAGETEGNVDALLEIKDTGISLRRFERILRTTGLRVDHRRFFLFNPIYRFKFGLRPREQFGLLAALPVVRDFVTTAAWYVVSKESG